MTENNDNKDARLVYKQFQEAITKRRKMVNAIIKATPDYIAKKYEITRPLLNNFFSVGRINIILGDEYEIKEKCLESEIDMDINVLKYIWEKLGISFVRFGLLEEVNSSIAIFEVMANQ